MQGQDNILRQCKLYSWKLSKSQPGSDVCIYFEDDEYEGLPPHTYSIDKNSNVLRDSDDEEITIRYLIYVAIK